MKFHSFLACTGMLIASSANANICFSEAAVAATKTVRDKAGPCPGPCAVDAKTVTSMSLEVAVVDGKSILKRTYAVSAEFHFAGEPDIHEVVVEVNDANCEVLTSTQKTPINEQVQEKMPMLSLVLVSSAFAQDGWVRSQEHISALLNSPDVRQASGQLAINEMRSFGDTSHAQGSYVLRLARPGSAETSFCLLIRTKRDINDVSVVHISKWQVGSRLCN